MRRAGRILTLAIIAVAPIAMAAEDASSAKASPPPTAASVDLDTHPLVNLHSRVVELEKKTAPRDPQAEIAMWRALGVVGVFFAVAWGFIRTAESRRETTLGMWKEFCQATKVGARDDPAAVLKEFATRFEAATAAYVNMGDLEKKLRSLEKEVRKRQ